MTTQRIFLFAFYENISLFAGRNINAIILAFLHNVKREKRKKGEEKSLRSEQFKTHFLHRQSAIATMNRRKQRKKTNKIAKGGRRTLFKNKQQEIYET